MHEKTPEPIVLHGADEPKKVWTTPRLKVLPVVDRTQSGVKPQPNETAFYFHHS